MSKNGGFYSILNITKEEGKIDFFKEKCQEFTFFYIVVFGGRSRRAIMSSIEEVSKEEGSLRCFSLMIRSSW